MRLIQPDGKPADGRVILAERKCWACGGIECLLSTGWWECEHCSRTDNPNAPPRHVPEVKDGHS